MHGKTNIDKHCCFKVIMSHKIETKCPKRTVHSASVTI